MEEEIIVRQKYLDKIKPFISKGLIKVLTGQRRVGKSYVLRQTIDEIKKMDKSANILYVNKEDLAFDFIKTADDLNNYVLQNTKDGVKNYVFIDEIQDIAAFEKALRSLLLNPAYDLYCTGSNAHILSGELSTFLSGRFIEIPIYSLSFNEFCEFHSLENTNETLQKYLKFGGLPYLKHLTLDDEIVFNYLKGVYNTIIYKDLIQRYKIRNAAFLENLTRFLAENTGHLFSAKKISDYLKSQNINIAISQIINYINYLTNTFLIKKVQRMDIAGKKIFEIGEKFYFEDLGLRHSINGFRQADIGKILENAVYNHLLINCYDVKIGQVGNLEIDFVAERGGEKLYVQVCYLLQDEKTIEREFSNLLKINDNYPKIVVSMDEFSGNTYEGIAHIHIRKFLSE
ncbi:MAG: ATP-binding protein [Dysgonamonadaceae bacterium]|jgi:predicted AAA+ superfamily ATPase|nr:ATP-binding protein [Dysgonamonadaceae bacterium]